MIDVATSGQEVVALLALRANRRRRKALGRFRLSATLADGQIAHIRAAVESAG